MKNRQVISLMALIILVHSVNSQDIRLTFSGTGASTSVDSVKIENLTTGTSLIVSGNETVLLSSAVTHVQPKKTFTPANIYPNPMTGSAILEIFPPFREDALITLFDLSGRPVAITSCLIEPSGSSFRISGLKTGFFIVNVKGKNYQFSGRLVSTGKGGIPSIEKLGISFPVETKDEKSKGAKGVNEDIAYIEYSAGDKMKFTGMSQRMSTIVLDSALSSKTVLFDFIPCVDGDNNSYPVVTIGNQVWMAENLKTTRMTDGTPIPNVTASGIEPGTWGYADNAYCWYNNDTANKNIYGALYKYKTLLDPSKLPLRENSKLCPVGWRVPRNADWESLRSQLGGYHLAVGKLKETGTAHWAYPNADATNESGFNALPAGSRSSTSFSGLHYGTTWWAIDQCNGPGSCGWGFGNEFYQLDWNYEGFSVRCIHGGTSLLPEFWLYGTFGVKDITSVSATAMAGIGLDNGSPVTDRGFCWGTEPAPDLSGPHTSDGSGTGGFQSNITGLTPATHYYARPYAINSAGTRYGRSVEFTTTISDIDGNNYEVVSIGTQVWMIDNLNVTRLNDGTAITLITNDDNSWYYSTMPAYCYYPGDSYSGALYNWQSVNSGKLCPSGWHVPSDAEWTDLKDFLIANGYNYDGSYTDNKIAKALAVGSMFKVSTVPGAPGNNDYSQKNNSTRFSANPAGSRGSTFSPSKNESAIFWSSSPQHFTGSYFIINYANPGAGLSYPDPGDKQLGFSVRCMKGEVTGLPLISTRIISSISSSTAVSGGIITSDGGSAITEKGVCWNSSGNPTIADAHTSNGSDTARFFSNLTGLSPGTRYFARSFATNSKGTAYGNKYTFHSKIIDIEGNNYNTTSIGNQVWMAENLKSTKFNDNTPVPLITGNSTWSGLTSPAISWYNNSTSNRDANGALYNWYTVNMNGKNICPAGWHVPLDPEWKILVNFLGGVDYAGTKLKEVGTVHWPAPNYGTNEGGFTALPSGCRINDGSFYDLTTGGYWWSATPADQATALYRVALYNEYSLSGYALSIKSGMSIRCLKGEMPKTPSVSTSADPVVYNDRAFFSVDILNDGGADVTEKGVCWSTSPNPTITGSHNSNGSGTRSFVSWIRGLTPGTKYYGRGYAINFMGTAYGNEIIFTTTP